MKDHVEVGHLTKYDAFRMNRDQAMNLEIWFKIRIACENSRPSLLPVRVAFRKKDVCDLPPKIPY